MTAPEYDPVVADALRSIPVPPPGPGFWEELEHRLDGGGTVEPTVESRSSSPYRLRIAVVAAAALALLAVGLVRSRGTEPVVRSGDTGVPPTPTSVVTRLAPGLPAPRDPDTEVGARTAVTAFVDAANRGDAAGLRSLLGPRSRAYAEAKGWNEGMPPPVAERWAPWGAPVERRLQVVSIDSFSIPQAESLAFVVLDGQVRRGGVTVTQLELLPVVAGESGGWLVEPWALDPATDDGVRLVPAPDAAAPTTAPDGALLVPGLFGGPTGTGPNPNRSPWQLHVPPLIGWAFEYSAPGGGGGGPGVQHDRPFGPFSDGRHTVVDLYVSRDGSIISGLAVRVEAQG